MLVIKHTIQTSASLEAIWKLWSDVPNWNVWDHGVESSTIDGPFVTGATGTLKPVGGPLLHTKLTDVQPMKSFVTESKLPLARIVVSHFMKQIERELEVTHQIEMRGVLAFLFAYVIGRSMKKNLPQEMQNMAKKAEAQ